MTHEKPSGRVGEVVWEPTLSRALESNLAAFSTRHGFAPADYFSLHEWSLAEPRAFYSSLWDTLGIIGEKSEPSVEPGADIRSTRFFPNVSLNYAENLLRDPDDRPAIIAHRDDGTRRQLARGELYQLVSRMTQALRAEGIRPGDRIAGLVTNDLESIALYLASAAIGAVWASCSPDFGPESASDRLGQIAPSILFAVAGYHYAGKQVDTTATIDAVAATRSIKTVVLIGGTEEPQKGRKRRITLDQWLAPFEGGAIKFHRQHFNAPMVILFSSGTTGKPKAIIHTAGGLLLQHLKELVLHCDLKPTDRLFYYTTCGWMMWNWLITGLATGATIVTFDGNPSYPTAARMPDMIDADKITIFGTSAKYIDSAARAGLKPHRTHRLATLRTVLSTGSPLLPQHFEYVYSAWKADLHLASISGGTDICGCFLGGVPTLPVRRGELQAPLLGMDVCAYSAEGHEVIGAPGELVCRSAHPTMPAGFWGDTHNLRYTAAYFSCFPGVWAHGDFVERRASGGFVIHGRSDTTLNPGGVRIGTAEIYRQVEHVPEIVESIVVGQDWEGDQRVVLFVRLAEGAALTDDLRNAIRRRIRAGATPRHVPAKIIAVRDIPRTRSGKISETAVRDTIHGRAVGNTGALANPDALAEYVGLADLET